MEEGWACGAASLMRILLLRGEVVKHALFQE